MLFKLKQMKYIYYGRFTSRKYRDGSKKIIGGGGGGAQKIMCAHAHHERQPRSPLRPPGSRARL